MSRDIGLEHSAWSSRRYGTSGPTQYLSFL